MHSNILFQISVAIVVATLFAIVARWTKQPVILGYIAAGVVLGQTEGLGWITTSEIEPISELGLILLLFMIGLEIDLKKLKRAGTPMLAVGVGQFAICVVLGLMVMPLLGFSYAAKGYAPLYLAVAAALSSTMIVVKLLYDKSELDTVPGRLTLGVLVFQDIWAILFLAVQPDLQNPAPIVIFTSLVKGAGMVAFALAASRYVLPVLFRSIAKVPELLVLGALAWCFFVALVAERLGLSLEMGALIAGVSLSTFPYNMDVVAKVTSLRDFFITLFFVSLGSKIPAPTLQTTFLALAIAGFLVVSRFLSITPILYKLKQGNRASLTPAINLSQISEFSLVICTMGVSLGHISQRVLAVVVLVLVITSVTSTYAIMFNYEIFSFLNPLLKRLGLRDLGEEQPADAEEGHIEPKPIVFVGFARHGSSLLHELLVRDAAHARDVGVVDFNPRVKEELDRRGIQNVYGDISHLDTLHHAEVAEAKVLLCTIPDGLLKGTSNMRLLKLLKSLAPEASVVVTAELFEEADEMYTEGAAFVFMPRLMGVGELADAVDAALRGEVTEHTRAARERLMVREEVLP